MPKTSNTIYRIDQLERNYCNLDAKLDKIMENHLPHLQMEMESLKTRVNVLFAVNIGSIILALLINKYL